jgi:hypothetical protein
MMRHLASRMLVVCTIFSHLPLYAWAGRGHNLVTQVAVRLLDQEKFSSDIYKPFLMKEDMLSHLSNIPDNGWKVASELRSMLDKTHFFEIDSMNEKELSSLLSKMPCKDSMCSAEVQKKLDSTGSAPWRTQQFAELMKAALKKIQKHPLSYTDTFFADEALKYAGLLSHFVGDLGNPHHAHTDFDGWETEQGGLHAYFEAEIVNALPLSLAQDVLEYAKKEKPFEKLILPSIAKGQKRNPRAICFALARNSADQLETLLKLDRDFSLKQKSTVQNGKKQKAERGKMQGNRI